MYSCGINGCKHTTQTLDAMLSHEHEHVINQMGDTIVALRAELAASKEREAKLKSLWKRDTEHLLEIGKREAKLRDALELVADEDYQSLSQIKDIARRALESHE